MASSYPTSLDSFTDPTSGSSLASPSHSGQHIDLNDAVEKIETKLGIGSSPASSAANGSVLVANGSGSTTWTAAPYGLQFIKADTITSGASKVITDCFTSDFQNYRVVISDVRIATLDTLVMRYGTTATGYYGSLYYDKFDGASTSTARQNNGDKFLIGLAENLANNGATSFDCFGPQTNAAHKGVHGTYWGAGYTGFFAGVLANSTQYTSMTIFTAGGTLFTNCNVYVYGYRKS